MRLHSVLLIASVFFLGSAPYLGDNVPPPKHIEGEDVTVTWESAQHAPRVLGWEDHSARAESRELLYPKTDELSVTIPRKGLGELPERLLLIPNDTSLAPLTLRVSAGKTKVEVSFSSIDKRELWLWGITPADPCPHSAGRRGHLRVGARMIHETSVYTRFSGLFAWKLELTDDDTREKAFYFTPDYPEAIESISASTLERANDISRALCHAHHGGSCNFTMETNSRAWGGLHEIVFVENEDFDKIKACPI